MNAGKITGTQICLIKLRVGVILAEMIPHNNINNGLKLPGILSLFAETVGHEQHEVRFDPDYCFSFSHISAFSHNSHSQKADGVPFCTVVCV